MMKNTNPKVDEMLSKPHNWSEETKKLRKIALDCKLTEELKWGKPCYAFEGKNVILIQGFKEYCALLFMKGALLKDSDNVLREFGENVQSGRQIRFTNPKDVAKLESTLKAYINEAIELEKSGAKVVMKKTAEYSVPEELEAAFAKSAKFKKAFDALTPGRQRGYLLHFAGAKQAATRESRIEKCTPAILSGKGLNE